VSKKSDLPKSVPRITRIKAGDKKAKKAKTSSKKVGTKTKKPSKTSRTNPIRAFGSYIKASFREIRLVKWPTRRETWAMTLAVVIYSLVIIAIVLLFDNIYDWLFKLVIK
jgi:preprotein translocase SecE subunit